MENNTTNNTTQQTQTSEGIQTQTTNNITAASEAFYADWEGNYVKFHSDTPKELILLVPPEKITPSGEVDRAQLSFMVLSEDGQEVKDKKMATSSRRLIAKLKPIIIRTLNSGRGRIHIIVTKVGEKFETQWSVQDKTE